MKTGLPLLLLVLTLAGAGCSSLEKGPSVPETVGPNPNEPAWGQSALQVYTAFDDHVDGGIREFPYSAYVIYDEQGKRVRSVLNHVGSSDGRPYIVPLPKGRYTVEGLASEFGRVRIPVVIQPRQLTEVHLQPGWKPLFTGQEPAELVYLPGGYPIGFRAGPGR